MKKYCFTQCFKRKMSNLGRGIVEFFVASGAIILIGIIFGAILFGIGYIQSFFMELTTKQYMAAGFSTVIILAISGWILYLFYKFFLFLKRRGTDFIVRKYEGPYEECSIFEECKIEPEEETNLDIDPFDEFGEHPLDNDLKGK